MARYNCNPVDLQARVDAWFMPAAPANSPAFVVVCDIGQGNMNVVVNTDGKPFLYYDMGGGIQGSLFTYPHPRPVLCYDGNPTILLSHWDGDHFKTALDEAEAGRLAGTAWMAPAQDTNTRAYRLGLTASAKAFRRGLVRDAELYVWPDGAVPASVTASYFTVLKVNGKDHNNHGLALRIASPNANGDFMLLTGDATYEGDTFANGVHGCDTHCVGLVSGHHTAEVGTVGDIPRPENTGQYAIAHSFGWGNAYGHPSTTGVNSYDGRNWPDANRLDTGGGEAGADFAGPRGNVGLLWQTPALGPGAVALGAGHVALNHAAIALIASASAELERYSPGLVEAPQIAVAAAHSAAVRVSAVPAHADSAHVAAAMVLAAAPPPPPPPLVAPLVAPPPPPPPPTLVVIAAGLGVVAGTLTQALVDAPAAAAAAAVAAVPAMADAVVTAVMTAALTIAQEINAAATGAAVAGRTIGSQARSASNAAYDHTQDVGLPATIQGAISDVLADAVINTTQAVQNANLPGRLEVKTAIAAALIEVARVTIGHSKHGYGALLAGRTPPVSAEESVAVVVLARNDLKAAIAAAAALTPAIPINPEAGAPQMNLNAFAQRTAAVAATAAICGQRAGATAAQAARAAVAAARVVLPAALGAPQMNCHRHPRTCPGVCSLAIHYACL